MKKKIFSILFALVLMLSFSLVTAVPVAAATGSVTLASTSSTQTIGYRYGAAPWTAAAALTPSNYSESPTWRAANEVIPQHSAWYAANAGDFAGAYWISTINSISTQEGNWAIDSWRLFKQEFNIPVNAYNITGTLYMTADNDAAAYLDNEAGKVGELGAVGDVYTAYHGQAARHNLKFSFPFNPNPGAHTLYIVCRNWGWSSNNPTALLYKATVTYDLAALAGLTPDEAYNLIGTQHTVYAALDHAVAGVPITFAVSGANTASGTVNTNASGVAAFTYTGANGGQDTITATVGDVTLSVTKYWEVNFLTGGGTIKTAKGKPAWTISGNVGYLPDGTIVGNFNIVDQLGNNHYKCKTPDFTSLVFNGTPTTSPPASNNTATFTGTFTDKNGVAVVLTLVITDNDESGGGADTVAVTGGPTIGSTTLSGGNFQVHDGFKG